MSFNKSWKEMEIGAVVKGGSGLLYKTGNWRSEKPIIDYTKCINCLICWALCPDSAILRKGNKVEVNYDYCKGCGICANECPTKAINMEKEEV
ncbi:MAG: 4Fe-4S binding protein [Candidatus Brockarchaeota archaeon]|nr:4Fe-4S binding protein [Candidatus Brockarchaeota archaeon]MBO3767725.1 4Fe-4S binding protein [Candidatus Brockarchaeota archaeon]MBO3801412.1 4Fe-4S binding protein [Candidatus Brockarchaeota archaeon]